MLATLTISLTFLQGRCFVCAVTLAEGQGGEIS